MMDHTTPQPGLLALKARYVFPATAEPIPDAAVTIQAGRIVAVGAVPPGAEVCDLGNVAVLPGLVNAHTHLEFSHLAEPIGEPGTRFVDWLRAAMALRPEPPARAAGAVAAGLRECLREGVTTLGEIAQPDWSPEPFARAGLDTTVFLELIGPTPDRATAAIELAREHVQGAGEEQLGDCPDFLAGKMGRSPSLHPGLSPHAPYSVRPELLAAAVKLSNQTRTPIAFHLAESREELEWIGHGTGPLRDMLSDLGAWDAQSLERGARPLDYLRTLSSAHRALVVHGNYLDDEEIALLADRSDRMAIVYCPRTHARFGHDAYPLVEMLRAGAAVALGTDSRASSPDLSMLEEMRYVARKHPGVPGATVLQLGTIRGARALGRQHEVGSLEPGKTADLAVVGLDERSTGDPYKRLFEADQPVVATWLAGTPVAGY